MLITKHLTALLFATLFSGHFFAQNSYEISFAELDSSEDAKRIVEKIREMVDTGKDADQPLPVFSLKTNTVYFECAQVIRMDVIRMKLEKMGYTIEEFIKR